MKTNGTKLILVLFSILFANQLSAQNMKWIQIDTISKSVIGGQLLPETKRNRFNRLPDDMQTKVRKEAWDLSMQSSGEYIEFYSNSPKIIVEYKLTEGLNMYHFSTTGVSGVDLYMKGKNGEWFWAPATMNIGKNIISTFNHINNEIGQRFRLYLPLYNHVAQIKIGVQEDKNLEIISQKLQQPIVIYGTSIAQGACASRAGLAWTNMLGRRLDRDIVNLGFSGNGRLEQPLIDFLLKTPSSLISLDCMPNLFGKNYTKNQIFDSIVNAVSTIRNSATTPILLVAHSGGNDQTYSLNTFKNEEYSSIQKPLDSAVKYLKNKGIKDLHYLEADCFLFDNESTVDGTHPNDIGMRKIADAYEKIIRQILRLDKGDVKANQPVTQFREYPGYDWMTRHQDVLEYNQKMQPKLVILGNSIMHYWAGNPKAIYARGTVSWESYIAPFKAVNMGFGWDRTENILWRIENGELDNFEANKIFIMAGTNNLSVGDTDENKNILKGIQAILHQIKIRQPKAKVYLSGIFPRKILELRVKNINLKIKKLAELNKVYYVDFSSVFLGKDAKINESLFSDGLHPNEKGYEALAIELQKELKK